MKQLWPHINVAGSTIVKESVEPMFKTMLPGPLASLHFTKIDLGPVPLRLSNVKTTKTETGGINLDLNLDWVGKADIQLDAKMMPALVSCGPVPTPRDILTFDSGRQKRGASWQAFHTALPFDECHPAGK